jgi:hypothetical protein
MMDENFIRNAFAVFGSGGSGRLQLSLFATVDGIPIGGKGSWKNHVTVESKLSWACLHGCMEWCVDGPQNWHEKFLLGRDSGKVLFD